MFSQRHSMFVLSLCTCVLMKINAQQQYNRLSPDNFYRHFIVNSDRGDTNSSIKPHNNIQRRIHSDNSNNIINSNNNVIKYQQQKQQRLRKEQTEWKPLTAQKNWFIMQATVATTHRNSHTQSQFYEQTHQQQQPHSRLPVNYYAYNHLYNHSNGKYKQVVTQSALPVIVNVNSNDSNSRNNSNNNEIGDSVVNANHQQPFVIAIEKSMRHNSVPKGLSHLMPQHDKNLLKKNIVPRNIDFGDGGTFMSSDAVEALQQHKQQEQLYHHKEVSSMYIGSHDFTPIVKSAVETDPTQAVANDDNDYVSYEFLVPFELALEKVKNFCESVKSIINNNDNKSVNKDDESDNEIDDIVATAGQDVNDIFTETASNEVQGRHNVAAAKASLATSKISSISSLSTFAGSSRKVKKLKRKFKKLLLPLLIAYKLKFLTLIPVLIGGLTLLVGTTGLAGFFFALFTAVMSLKSTSGSKSFIVKKIL